MRTEGDSWDITTGVGATALLVAAARALEAQRPQPLAVDEFAAVFCRAAGGDWAAVVDGESTDSPLSTADFGTAFVAFQGARTRYFDAYFAAAADAGVRQVVILAAGLDSRAFRLDWPDGTVVYELDLPRVLAFKDQALAGVGATPKARRVEIAVDLRDDWPAELRANGFDPDEPAAFIVEGLMIYLTAEAQHRLCEGIDALAAPGSWVGIEDGEPIPEEDLAAARAAGDQAAAGGTDFFNLIYNEQHEPSQDWFGARGWTAEATPLAGYLDELGRGVEPDSDGGQMVARNTLVIARKA